MRRLTLALPLMALALAGAGCGGPSYSTNPVTGTTTYQDAEGNRVQVGANVRIPDNFPKDVPQYPDGNVMQAATAGADAENGATYLFTSNDSVATVSGWYKDTLLSAGWTVDGTYSISGQETTTYVKGDSTISVMVSPGDTNGSTTMVIWAND